MKIKIEVYDVESGETLEELGECLTDNPTRAIQMYNQDEAWAERGYNADIRWVDITNPAAAALGKIGGRSTSDAKRKASAANGKRGGRPRKS